MIKKPVKWVEFDCADGERWAIFLTTRKLTKCLQKQGGKGPSLAICLFNQRRIYIDSEVTRQELLDSALHECAHVAMRCVPIPESWEEDIVETITPRLIHIMKEIGVRWPAIPHEIVPLLKVEAA